MTESASDGHPTRQSPVLPVLVVGRPQRVARALPASAPAISADGRYVAFVSTSGTLVAGDANGAADVFVRDTVTNRTILASRSRFGGSGAGSSLQPSISADGQVVAFTSSAADLVAGDDNGTLDVFVHDLRTGRIELVSRGTDGELGDHDSFSPSLSADGRHVAFSSLAENLDSRDRNDAPDVYVHDRLTRRTTLVSVGNDGEAGPAASGQPSISADGKLVAFTSVSALDAADANGTADVYLRDVAHGTTELVSRGMSGGAADAQSYEPVISADGRSVAFTSAADDLVVGDDNGEEDVFVRHADGGAIRLVSTTAAGRPALGASHAPSISANGRRVAFLSGAPDVTPDPSAGEATHTEDSAYLRDLDGIGTARVAFATGRVPADGRTTAVVVSGTGGEVAFVDDSTNLAGDEADGDGDGDGDGDDHVYRADVTTAAIPGPATSAHDEREPGR